MDTFSFNDWLVLSIAGVVTLIAIAEVIEGCNKDLRSFASLEFVNRTEQRICRSLWAVVCPLLYVWVVLSYLLENGLTMGNFGKVVVVGFALFIWRYVVEILLYIVLGVALGVIWCVSVLCSKDTWRKFKNWLWEYNKY